MFAGLFYYSCSSSNYEVTKGLQKGEYDLTIYDSVNHKLMDGTMNIESVEGAIVKGKYKIVNRYDSSIAAINRLNAGKMTAQYSSATGDIGFNMNPLIADDNIFLGGKVYADSISGKWNHSIFRGTMGWGYFKAVLR